MLNRPARLLIRLLNRLIRYNEAEKRELIQGINWFHSIDLGDGVVTAGLRSQEELQACATEVFKHSVTGKSVLDVGAWDGFFSFEAARRGAARVMATDFHCWSGAGWGDKTGFNMAREFSRLPVHDLEIDVPDISKKSVGMWDIVLFLGVFYHMKNPLDAIERVAAIARERLVVETYIDERLPAEPPAMVFYPRYELNGDGSNWWGPNPSCVMSMLDICGFHRVEFTAGSNSRGYFHAFREG